MKEKVLSIVRNIKKGHVINDDDHLVFDRILSSLETLILISELESEFKIKIPVEAVIPENFDTVDSIVELVKSLT